ncbi:MAG: ABC transporter permease [Bacteroidota bacterium]
MAIQSNDNYPPRWPLKLFRRFFKENYLEEIDGDMEERFYDNTEQYSLRKARQLYILDSFKLLRPVLMKKLGGDVRLNQYGMIKNNLKIAWRQIHRQKVFSGIKIGGFAISIAACILITLFIGHNLSYDQHYEQRDRIFRIVNQWSEGGEAGYWSNVHGPLKEVLEDNIPEIEKIARVVLWSWGDAGQNHVRLKESNFNTYEEGFIYADPEILEVLEVPMVYGSQVEALAKPNRVVISLTKASQYFPNENPVGRSLVLNDNPETTYVVGGVMEDFHTNSHLQVDFILTLYDRKKGPGTSGWCCTNYNMYTRLTPQANKEEVEKKTVAVRNALVIDQLESVGSTGLDELQAYHSYYFQPIENVFLNPEKVGDDLAHGSKEMVSIFALIALVILLLACINFVNLSIAKSIKRAKEVGLRKVVGSDRSTLIFQYLSESCLYSLLAIFFGVLLAWIFLPAFNLLADTYLSIPWSSIWFLPVIICVGLVIGLLSGVYPAFFLSSFQPVEVLKGGRSGSYKISILRGGMIVFQFAATVILIIGSLIIHQQFQYLMNKSLGYEKDHVLNIVGLDSMDKNKRASFKDELLGLASVESASLSDFLPVEGGYIQNRSFWIAERRQVDGGFEAARWTVDEDYLSTMKIKIKEGRNFNDNSAEEQSIIINEEMVYALGLEEPLGVQVIDMFDERYTIVGVVKNFHFESLYGEVRPLAMVKGNGKSTLSVKVATADIPATIAAIDNIWRDFNSRQSMRYHFMDQRFEDMYKGLLRIKTIFLLFAILSILIACLGLFALSIHMIEQRGKEISVRKVLGASIGRIFGILTVDFIKLVFIALVIAIPLAWYLMDYLLQDIAYRIELSWQ